MFNSIMHMSKLTTALAVALFASSAVQGARAAQPAMYQNIKNLMAPTYRAPAMVAAEPEQLTWKKIKKIIATAERPEDHLKIARYHTAVADRLDAVGAGYEAAAEAIGHSPIVKNLMAPNTAARYAFFAKQSREKAKSNRASAILHEQMARNLVASR